MSRFSYEPPGSDTAIWNGDPEVRPVGSSGGVRDSRPGEVWVTWGSGQQGWEPEGVLLTPRQAANRGIEPWAKVFA